MHSPAGGERVDSPLTPDKVGSVKISPLRLFCVWSGNHAATTDRRQNLLKAYRKKTDQTVVAVQLDLDTKGFEYQKWGNKQSCKAGDWLVDNQGDVYTVSKNTFESTYAQLSPGVYCKSTSVWAERSENAGVVATKEGKTHYQSGDYLVYNNTDKSDGYAVKKDKFESMYELQTKGDGDIEYRR